MESNANITYHVEDRIATITMDRPKKLNAIDDDMVRAESPSRRGDLHCHA
jgi:enoyl-CoA hydratase/carnithine racemase